ncbi:MAG TPA: trehalose-phosphatase, partial [Syntrophales bacterium]|nr:trehalose-phosphatase [Syntrophales bacterium]
LVERKKFSIAVHYRKVRQEEVPQVEDRVDRVLEQSSGLRKSFGKKVFELQPEIDWNKGKALFWVLDALDLDGPDVLPFYIGDDTTDEDAFRAIEDRGIGIVVMNRPRPTRARYALKDPDAVGRFLESLERVIRR